MSAGSATQGEADIRIDADQALVLYELLSRYEATSTLETQDQSEVVALRGLRSAAEDALVQPLHSDYGTLLDAARARLRGNDVS